MAITNASTQPAQFLEPPEVLWGEAGLSVCSLVLVLVAVLVEELLLVVVASSPAASVILSKASDWYSLGAAVAARRPRSTVVDCPEASTIT